MNIVTAKSSVVGPLVGIVRLPHGEGLALPSYETAGAAGMDLRAAVPDDRPLLILPGKRALVPTGLVLEIPEGFEGQVRPRSGLAFKHGITCLNTPGTIDSDYRGEVKVLLINLGDEDFSVDARHAHRPDRLCPGRAGERSRSAAWPAARRAAPAGSARPEPADAAAKARHLRLRRHSRRHREAGKPPPVRMADRGRLSRKLRALPQAFLRPQPGLRAAGDRSGRRQPRSGFRPALVSRIARSLRRWRRGDPACRELIAAVQAAGIASCVASSARVERCT